MQHGAPAKPPMPDKASALLPVLAGKIEGFTPTMTAIARAISTGDLEPAIGRGLQPIAIVSLVDAAARALRPRRPPRRPAARRAG